MNRNNSVTVSTPYFCYDLDQITENITAYKKITQNGVRILYATMANARMEIIESVKDAGIGVFVNSISHLETALEVGIKPADIVFAGSGHTGGLLQFLAALGVNYHADSSSQLERYMVFSPIGSIGLRVNVGSLLEEPESDPAPRLGMLVDDIRQSIEIYGDRISTLHVYVGTNLLNSDIHCRCLESLVDLAEQLSVITDIDLGGGFAFAPGDSHDHGMWSEVLQKWESISNGKKDIQLTIEPGRSIVRTGGEFFVMVTDIKKRFNEIFATVDSSGTWFPRKIVHGLDEDIVSVINKTSSVDGLKTTHICGSTTFSMDFLSISKLPDLEIGDIICFSAAGAYNESMHMDFLGIPAPAVVIKKDGIKKLVRENAKCNLNGVSV
jgi:diaminopimelate decarboxylase